MSVPRPTCSKDPIRFPHRYLALIDSVVQLLLSPCATSISSDIAPVLKNHAFPPIFFPTRHEREYQRGASGSDQRGARGARGRGGGGSHPGRRGKETLTERGAKTHVAQAHFFCCTRCCVVLISRFLFRSVAPHSAHGSARMKWGEVNGIAMVVMAASRV